MTAHNGNPADSPKPAQCSQPGCYVWTPHTHYGPSVTMAHHLSHEEVVRHGFGAVGSPAEAHNAHLQETIQRLSDYLDSVSLNSWKHGACWAAEDAIKTLLAERDDLRAIVSAQAEVMFDDRGDTLRAECKCDSPPRARIVDCPLHGLSGRGASPVPVDERPR
jgi:hypothetical protein